MLPDFRGIFGLAFLLVEEPATWEGVLPGTLLPGDFLAIWSFCRMREGLLAILVVSLLADSVASSSSSSPGLSVKKRKFPKQLIEAPEF